MMIVEINIFNTSYAVCYCNIPIIYSIFQIRQINNVVTDENTTIKSVFLMLLMAVSSFEVSTSFSISSSKEDGISMFRAIA